MNSSSEDENKETIGLKLQEELSSMSFEDLLKLKSKLGTKVFNSTAFKKNSNFYRPNIEKRLNKNRPREISSKQIMKNVKPISVKPKILHRDPRFDDISGNYNETYFNQAYSFLSDVKMKEKEKLKQSLKKEKNPEKKEQLDKLLKRITQQELSKKNLEEELVKEKEMRKQERENILKGKNPFYLKKSVKKKIRKEEKLKTMEGKGKLDKYLKKKEKKILSNDRKHLKFL